MARVAAYVAAAVAAVLSSKHVGDTSHDGTGDAALLVGLSARLSTVVVLWRLGLVATGREQAGRELPDQLAGRVLATVAALTAVVAVAAATSQELAGKATQGIRAVSTSAS
jgi:hypothetical protein